jgi:hypothetical protein
MERVFANMLCIKWLSVFQFYLILKSGRAFEIHSRLVPSNLKFCGFPYSAAFKFQIPALNQKYRVAILSSHIIMIVANRQGINCILVDNTQSGR